MGRRLVLNVMIILTRYKLQYNLLDKQLEGRTIRTSYQGRVKITDSSALDSVL